MVNESIYLYERCQRLGYARFALALQVRTASLCGIRSIYANVGEYPTPGQKGHFVWPSLGFDGRIPDDIWNGLPKTARDACGRQADGAVLLQAFLASNAEAKEVWENYGKGFRMKLSTDCRTKPASALMNFLRGTGLW